MTPTLSGRMQSRFVLLLIVGVPLTLVLGAVLPRPTATTTLSDMYEVFFAALVLVGVVGIVWELIYHGLQQFRWEKDWPTIFGLVTGIPEGIVVYLLLDRGFPWEFGDVPISLFLQMFISLAQLAIEFLTEPKPRILTELSSICVDKV